MTAFRAGDPLTLNRLYGRSSGHKLRKGQQDLVERLLPALQVEADGEISSAASMRLNVIICSCDSRLRRLTQPGLAERSVP